MSQRVVSATLADLRESITEPVVIQLGDGLMLDVPPAGQTNFALIRMGLGSTQVSYGEAQLDVRVLDEKADIIQTIALNNDSLTLESAAPAPSQLSAVDQAHQDTFDALALDTLRKQIFKARLYDDALGKRGEAPTGDDYNRLCEILNIGQ
jgi:hypothetical protein